MLGYLSLGITCSSQLTVFRSQKTVRFSEPIMSADKYPSIFSCQMEAMVYISCFKTSCCDLNFAESLFIFTILVFPDSELYLLNGYDFYFDLY